MEDDPDPKLAPAGLAWAAAIRAMNLHLKMPSRAPAHSVRRATTEHAAGGTPFGSAGTHPAVSFIFPRKPGSVWGCYLFAVATSAIAFSIRLVLDPALHNRSPLLLFTLAVVASAIRGGFGPGILATALGVLGAAWFFPPSNSLAIDVPFRAPAIFEILTFLAVGIVLSWLTSELLRLRWQSARMVDQLRSAIAERDAALANIRLLSGFLPICAHCKRIRDERGHWRQMEVYVEEHSEAQFTHGMCPECTKLYWDEPENRPPA